MVTSTWGPALWTSLHLIAHGYPVSPTNEQKKNYCKFVLALKDVLPCRYCRENFENNLRTVQFGNAVFENRETFARFIYDLHNAVNLALGKEKYEKTFEEVDAIYEMCRAKDCNKTDTNKKTRKESGCIHSARRIPLKCSVRLTPKSDTSCKTFEVDERCYAQELDNS